MPFIGAPCKFSSSEMIMRHNQGNEMKTKAAGNGNGLS